MLFVKKKKPPKLLSARLSSEQIFIHSCRRRRERSWFWRNFQMCHYGFKRTVKKKMDLTRDAGMCVHMYAY